LDSKAGMTLWPEFRSRISVRCSRCEGTPRERGSEQLSFEEWPLLALLGSSTRRVWRPLAVPKRTQPAIYREVIRSSPRPTQRPTRSCPQGRCRLRAGPPASTQMRRKTTLVLPEILMRLWGRPPVMVPMRMNTAFLAMRRAGKPETMRVTRGRLQQQSGCYAVASAAR